MAYTIERCRNLLRTGRDRYEKTGERVPESINVGDWLLAQIDKLPSLSPAYSSFDEVFEDNAVLSAEVERLEAENVRLLEENKFLYLDQPRMQAEAWDEGHHVGMQACVFNLATGRMNDEPNPFR